MLELPAVSHASILADSFVKQMHLGATKDQTMRADSRWISRRVADYGFVYGREKLRQLLIMFLDTLDDFEVVEQMDRMHEAVMAMVEMKQGLSEVPEVEVQEEEE